MEYRCCRLKKAIVCLIIWTIISQVLPFNPPVLAEGKVTSTENFSGSGVVTIDGKEYLKPLPPGQGEFRLSYNVKNGDNANITRVRIQESVLDRNGKLISGPEALIDESGVSAGQSRTYTGKTYLLGGEGAAFTILYSLWYQTDASSDWILLKDNSSKTIEAISTDISVTYTAQPSGNVTAGQEVVYTAELKSNANVRLENIEVRDSVFGTLGTIAVLNPGERAVVSRAFKVNQTTESHIILSFDDPMGIQEKLTYPMSSVSTRVEVSQEEPVYRLDVSGSVNKNRITSEEEVDFVFKLKNAGNKELLNVKGIDWNGNEFYSREQLLPGQEETIRYSAKVSPGKSYEVKFIGTSPDGKKVETSYTVNFDAAEVMLTISYDITPEEIEAGDTVTIEYFLKNTGDIALVDIRVEEPEFGQVAEFDRLEPGEEKSFSIEELIETDTEIYPHVYAKDEKTGDEYEFRGELQIITVKKAGAPHLTVTLTADPDVLEEEGIVDLICTISNDGDVTINNIEAVLKERDINIGSILTLEPGEEKSLTLSGISVDEDETFTAVVKGYTEDGEEVEFVSAPCKVTVGGQLDGEQGGRNSKLAFLKNVLAVIIVLILLTASGLIYMIRDMGKGKRRIKKQTKSR